MTPLLNDGGRITSRVLVVEPDDDTRRLHRQLLECIGCEVVEGFDGRDALVKALTYHPALVMTGIHLPFFDGLALCELLRRDSTTRRVPILVVTTERGRAQLERARAAGADACLVKPATLDALQPDATPARYPWRVASHAADRESDHRRGALPVRIEHPSPLRAACRQSQVKVTPPVRNRHTARATRPAWSVPHAIAHCGTDEVTSVGSALATQNNGTSSCVRRPDRADHSSIDNARVNSGVFADVVGPPTRPA